MASVLKPIKPKMICSNVPQNEYKTWTKGESFLANERCYVPVSLCDERITSGNCQYNKFSSTTDAVTHDVTNMKYQWDGTQTADELLYQTTSELNAGTIVLVYFEVKTMTNGTVAPYIQGTVGTAVSEAGFYWQLVTAGSADNKIGLVGDEDYDGDGTNISIKDSGPYTLMAVYEAQQSTTGEWPPDNLASWVQDGYSNRSKALDPSNTSQTEHTDRIIMKLTADNCSGLGFAKVEATTIQYIVSYDGDTDSSSTSVTPAEGEITIETAGSRWWDPGDLFEAYSESDPRVFMAGDVVSYDHGAKELVIDVSVYDDPDEDGPYDDWVLAYAYANEIINLYVDDVLTWEELLWKPFTFRVTGTADFPVDYFISCRVIISGFDGEDIKIGNLAVGQEQYLGKAVAGYRGPTVDYSTVTTDTQGTTEFVPRESVKNPNFELSVERDQLDVIDQALTQLAATVCFYNINNEDEDETDFVSFVTVGYRTRVEPIHDDVGSEYVTLYVELMGVT